MSTTARPARSTLRRRLLRPQFSLRFLLLAMTAFAIGFPIWYRWPIEEVKLQFPLVTRQVGSTMMSVEDKSAPPVVRTTTTWRRNWGQGKVKHGPLTVYFPEGDQRTVTYFDNDERHGSHVASIKGVPWNQGRHERGKQEGQWMTSIAENGEQATVDWHQGQIHGQAEIRAPGGKIDRMRFDRGRITHLNDQPVSSPLLDRISRGEIESPEMAYQLHREFALYFNPSITLAGLLSGVEEAHQVPLLVSPHITDLRVPLTGLVTGINLQSALVVLTHGHGLDCDYRYGCLWITTAEDAKDWRDPTGVADLRFKSGTSLAAAWNEPIKEWNFDEPLAASLSKIFTPLGINIDTTRIAPTADNPDPYHVKLYLSINGNYLPLHHLLGLLLYKTRCRCQLDGQTLVILPPEKAEGER